MIHELYYSYIVHLFHLLCTGSLFTQWWHGDRRSGPLRTFSFCCEHDSAYLFCFGLHCTEMFQTKIWNLICFFLCLLTKPIWTLSFKCEFWGRCHAKVLRACGAKNKSPLATTSTRSSFTPYWATLSQPITCFNDWVIFTRWWPLLRCEGGVRPVLIALPNRASVVFEWITGVVLNHKFKAHYRWPLHHTLKSKFVGLVIWEPFIRPKDCNSNREQIYMIRGTVLHNYLEFKSQQHSLRQH